jgi:hypothetical protein
MKRLPFLIWCGQAPNEQAQPARGRNMINKNPAPLVDVLLFSLFLSLFVLLANPPNVETQSCPNIQPADTTNPQSLCWPAGVTVQYYFTWDPDGRPFTQQELTLYTQAFNAWNNHRDPNHNCSGVFFSSSSGVYSLEVRKVSDQNGWFTQRHSNGSYLDGAVITVGGTSPYPETDALKRPLCSMKSAILLVWLTVAAHLVPARL